MLNEMGVLWGYIIKSCFTAHGCNADHLVTMADDARERWCPMAIITNIGAAKQSQQFQGPTILVILVSFGIEHWLEEPR